MTPVSNDVVDSLKSLTAKGLYVELRMMHDGARIGCRHLATLFEEGRDKIARCLNQLIEVGVLARVVWQVGNGQWITKYLVSDQPLDTADILEIAGQYRATYVTVSADLARPLRDLGLTYSVNDTGKEHVIRVSGFGQHHRSTDANTLVTPESGFPSPGWTEPEKPLVTPESGFSSPGDAGAVPTGCQKSGSHKVFTYSSNPSLREEPPLAAGEGGMAPLLPPHPVEDPAGKETGAGDEVPEFLEEQTNHVMGAVVKTFPSLPLTDLRAIEGQVRSLLMAGHTNGALTLLLTSNTGGIKMLWLHVQDGLRDLPETEAIVREYHQLAAPPALWCGNCDQRTRLIDHHDCDGQTGTHRCHVCHPDRAATPPNCNICHPAARSVVIEQPRKSVPWRKLLQSMSEQGTGS